MRGLCTAVGLALVHGYYWLWRERRVRYQQRCPGQAARALFRLGRNVGAMLARVPLDIRGSLPPAGGAVLYSVHLGVWEAAPEALAARGRRVGIVVNRYGHVLDTLLDRWRGAAGIRIFSRGEALAMVRFLQSGGVIAMLVDGNRLDAKLPAARRLARIARCPLMPFAARLEGARGVLALNVDLDKLMGEHAHDYLWFYRSRA